MLENALKEEKEALEKMIAKLQPIVDEFINIELRLQHINALLGIESAENSNGNHRRINWAKLCRENGLPIKELHDEENKEERQITGTLNREHVSSPNSGTLGVLISC